MSTKGLRNAAIVSFIVSMAILFIGGYFAKDHVPPIPNKVVVGEKLLADKETILRGQDVY
ncbi:hypothetical protein [Thermogutta sp.]|jgi:nitric oxide reductase subunit B